MQPLAWQPSTKVQHVLYLSLNLPTTSWWDSVLYLEWTSWEKRKEEIPIFRVNLTGVTIICRLKWISGQTISTSYIISLMSDFFVSGIHCQKERQKTWEKPFDLQSILSYTIINSNKTLNQSLQTVFDQMPRKAKLSTQVCMHKRIQHSSSHLQCLWKLTFTSCMLAAFLKVLYIWLEPLITGNITNSLLWNIQFMTSTQVSRNHCIERVTKRMH